MKSSQQELQILQDRLDALNEGKDYVPKETLPPTRYDTALADAIQDVNTQAEKHFTGGFAPGPVLTKEEQEGLIAFLHQIVAYHSVGGTCHVAIFAAPDAQRRKLRKPLPPCFEAFENWYTMWDEAILKCFPVSPGMAKKGQFHFEAEVNKWMERVVETWNKLHTQSRMEARADGWAIFLKK